MNELTISILAGFLLILSYLAHGELKYDPNAQAIPATTTIEREIEAEDIESPVDHEAEGTATIAESAPEASAVSVSTPTQANVIVNAPAAPPAPIPVQQAQVIQAIPAPAPTQYAAPIYIVPAPSASDSKLKETLANNSDESDEDYDSEDGDSDEKSIKKSKLAKTKAKRRHLEDRSADIIELRLEEDRMRQELDRASKLFNNFDEEKKATHNDDDEREVEIEDESEREIEIENVNTGPVLVAPPAVADLGYNDNSSKASVEAPANSYNRAGISLIAGMSSLNDVAGYEVDPKIMWGFIAGYLPSDYVGVDIGYTYSLFDAAPTQGLYAESNFFRLNDYSIEQHVVSLDAKLYVLPLDSILRPYVGAGLSYIISQLDFKSEDYSGRRLIRDRDIRSFGGQLLAGTDLHLNKSFSLGASFKYFNVFSSDSDTNNYSSNSGYGGYGYNGFNVDQEEKAREEQIGDANFYQVSGGLTFHF